MNIALLGYGKMGKVIKEIALDRGHKIGLIIDVDNGNDFNPEKTKDIDVAIDFSTPTSAYDNILKSFENNVPIVCGTTGWIDKKDEVEKKCSEQNQTFFWASNFSLGVNIFFKLNKHLAGILNRFPQYDVKIDETHHTAKLDAPSGTAITLAEGLLEKIDRKSDWKLDSTEKEVLNITAHRIENVPGIHEITYESDEDFISIKHDAKSRRGFALGAVIAAEFIYDKKGIFTMDDVLNLE
jgi:4-hydroxy-tetrahydrodipicolinate reductase